MLDHTLPIAISGAATPDVGRSAFGFSTIETTFTISLMLSVASTTAYSTASATL